MKQKSNQASRRGFLTGMVTGLGVAAVAASAGGKTAKAGTEKSEAKSKGPVLFRHTAEAERYYKTLYS